MIKNKLIIIPYNLPQNWVCDYMKQTIKILSKNNFIISFLWQESLSLKEIILNKIKFKKKFTFIRKKNSCVNYTPIHFLPFKRFDLIRRTNLIINLLIVKFLINLNKNLSQKRKILWIFDPEQNNLIGRFKEDLSLYDCVDFHSSIDPVEAEIKKENERNLMKKVGLVFTNSPSLYRLKNHLHPKVFQVPQGCNIDLFLKTKSQPLSEKLKKMSYPRIGFIGNINFRLDFSLIKNLALDNPNLSFIFIGPQVNDLKQDTIINLNENLKELQKVKNIYFLGKKSKKRLIDYIDNFDLEIIPYNIKQEFNLYCYPMKVFEFFARGKPVISTPIKSLIPLQPYVKIAKDAKEFSKEIKKILKSGWPKKYQQKQKELAIANSWQAKIEKISQVIEKEFPKKFND